MNQAANQAVISFEYFFSLFTRGCVKEETNDDETRLFSQRLIRLIYFQLTSPVTSISDVSGLR